MTPRGIERLKLDEGCRLFVYDDKSGRQLKAGSGCIGNPTVGYGRNLATRGLTQAEADTLLANDIAAAEEAISQHVTCWPLLHPVWQDVLVMVEFNTGDVFQFREMIAAMQAGNAKSAALDLEGSRAAKELPGRYGRMRDAILRKEW